MEPTLKEIHEAEGCDGSNCRGCEMLQECEGCGEKFCGATRLYESEWRHDKDGNSYCPECSDTLPEIYPHLFDNGSIEA
jgi:hypothetical protein